MRGGVGTVRTGLRLEVVRLQKAAAGQDHAAPSVRENLATRYAAVEEGFASPLPSLVKDELEGCLACGVLARGSAIVQCENAECRQKKLVA